MEYNHSKFLNLVTEGAERQGDGITTLSLHNVSSDFANRALAGNKNIFISYQNGFRTELQSRLIEESNRLVVIRHADTNDFYYTDTFQFSDSSGTHTRVNFRCDTGDIIYTLTLREDNTWKLFYDVLQTSSITDNGGYFTTDTVEGALQEIGAELAGINTLLGSGIQISFTINIPEESEVNTFSAVPGTTWKEWVGKGRPVSTISGLTLYCYSDDGIVFGDEAGVYALALEGTWVHGNDTITSGAAYTIDHYGG